jgi:hypothetical protein
MNTFGKTAGIAVIAMALFLAYGFAGRTQSWQTVPDQQFRVFSFDESSKTLYILITDPDMLAGTDNGCENFALMIDNIFQNPSITWIIPVNVGFIPSKTRLIDRSWGNFLLAGFNDPVENGVDRDE